jgi:hypothetical protein
VKLLFTAMTLGAAMLGTPSLACSPAPEDQAEARARDLRAVTSVYEAQLEGVVVEGPYADNIDFTLKPTAAIWGPVSPISIRLSYEAGACSNWFFLMDDQSDRPPSDGMKVIVMANPEGLADGHWLYILRADADYVEGFMRDWRAVRAGQSLPRFP